MQGSKGTMFPVRSLLLIAYLAIDPGTCALVYYSAVLCPYICMNLSLDQIGQKGIE